MKKEENYNFSLNSFMQLYDRFYVLRKYFHQIFKNDFTICSQFDEAITNESLIDFNIGTSMFDKIKVWKA